MFVRPPVPCNKIKRSSLNIPIPNYVDSSLVSSSAQLWPLIFVEDYAQDTNCCVDNLVNSFMDVENVFGARCNPFLWRTFFFVQDKEYDIKKYFLMSLVFSILMFCSAIYGLRL